MSDGMPQQATSRRWGILAVLMMMVFMAHFNRQSITVAGDEALKGEYGFSPEQLGYIYSTFLLTYTLFMTPGGWLGDRIGAVKTLMLMGFVFGIFEALTGAVSLFPTQHGVLIGLVVVRLCAGVSSSPLHPNASRVVSRWMMPYEQPFANGMVTASAMFGISSTYYLFGWMIDRFHWPTAFVVTGSVAFLLTIVWAVLASERPDGDVASSPPVDEAETNKTVDTGATPSTWTLLKNRNLVALTISYAAVGYFQYLFFYWIEHYYKDVLHLEEYRTYSTISLLSMAAGMLIGGYITKHLETMRLPIPGLALIPVTGLLVAAACVLFGGYSEHRYLVLFWFMLALGAVGACEGPMWTLAIRMGRNYGGTAGGIFNTGGNLGGIIAPIMTPSIGERYGWDKPLWIASAFCVIGALAWYWIDTKEKPDLEEE
ncbi:MAG: MFS transporter [Planctomycetota bacterium]|nr:MFS transporter [Planctomycetota bacterium]MDA1212468.1 MFS transporter [Planctomycetota bacterium]